MSNDKTFKDFVKDDLDNVFFNALEFSEKHKISSMNGVMKEYEVMIDNDILTERKLKGNSDIENIYLGDLLFFVKEGDLDFVPIVGKTLFFDKKQYVVSGVNSNFGVFEIILTSNRG